MSGEKCVKKIEWQKNSTGWSSIYSGFSRSMPKNGFSYRRKYETLSIYVELLLPVLVVLSLIKGKTFSTHIWYSLPVYKEFPGPNKHQKRLLPQHHAAQHAQPQQPITPRPNPTLPKLQHCKKDILAAGASVVPKVKFRF